MVRSGSTTKIHVVLVDGVLANGVALHFIQPHHGIPLTSHDGYANEKHRT
jgi:hypothetical protein